MAQQLGVRGQRMGSSGQRARSGVQFVQRPAVLVSRVSSISSGSSISRHVCLAGKLDEVSLFADSSMLGPSSSTTAAAQAAAAGVDSVELKSKVRAQDAAHTARRRPHPACDGHALAPLARVLRCCCASMRAAKAPAPKRPRCPHPTLLPQLGLDYAPLAQYLKEGDFRKVCVRACAVCVTRVIV